VVTIVSSDDWTGMYVEGELLVQGHSLPIDEVIYAILRERPKHIEVTPEQVEKWGWSFPSALSEIEEA
jgi:hypothetical protein